MVTVVRSLRVIISRTILALSTIIFPSLDRISPSLSKPLVLQMPSNMLKKGFLVHTRDEREQSLHQRWNLGPAVGFIKGKREG